MYSRFRRRRAFGAHSIGIADPDVFALPFYPRPAPSGTGDPGNGCQSFSLPEKRRKDPYYSYPPYECMTPRSTDSEDTLDESRSWDRLGRSPSIAVVEEIAARRGVEPTDLDVVLYDSVDPEALDRLFLEQQTIDMEATLDVAEYRVTVRSDGSLLVRDVTED